MKFTAIPKIEVSKLIGKDGKFKSSVLEELNSSGNEHDIMPLIREYIECIGVVHNKAREILMPRVSDWEEIIINAINLYKESIGTEAPVVGLAALILTESDKMIDRVPLFLLNSLS